MSRARPATVRFDFDADLLGLAEPCVGNDPTSPILATLADGSKNVSVPQVPIKTPAAPDSKWIPTVATLG